MLWQKVIRQKWHFEVIVLWEKSNGSRLLARFCEKVEIFGPKVGNFQSLFLEALLLFLLAYLRKAKMALRLKNVKTAEQI